MAKGKDRSPPLSGKEKRKRLEEAKQRKAAALRSRNKLSSQEIQQQQLNNAIQQHRKLKDPTTIIELIFDGKGDSFHTPYGSKAEVIKRIYTSCRTEEMKRAAKKLLVSLERHHSKALDSTEKTEYANAVIYLANNAAIWKHTPESWNPKSKNVQKQFSDILRWLLATYPVPLFMDSAWFQAVPRYQRWWLHITDGGNIRKAPDFPLDFTKKMAHHMMEAPSNYSIPAAIRWGQIHALGGNERNVRGLLDSFLCQVEGIIKQQDEFWQSVFRWFLENTMLDPNHYTSIIDYIKSQKYTVPVGATVPAQPNFTMHGRTPEALLRQVEAWHDQLDREGRLRNRQRHNKTWEHHGLIQDFELIAGPENKPEKQVAFRIEQLLSEDELFNEGRRLGHCVGSYGYSCATGRISIWSTRKYNTPKSTIFEPLGTIELDNSQNKVIQFRAHKNGKPTQQASNLMARWASLNRLTISSWL